MVYDRIYVQKGMESDYYTEVISSELTEGMQVVLPSNYSSGLYDLQWEIG